MPRLSSLRLAGLIGGLGTALVIAGFFLPCRFVTDTFPPNPASYSANSFWSMLVNTVTSENFRLDLSDTHLAIGSYLLALLVLLLTSRHTSRQTEAGLGDTQSRVCHPRFPRIPDRFRMAAVLLQLGWSLERDPHGWSRLLADAQRVPSLHRE